MAPERLHGDEYGWPADLWAAGLLLLLSLLQFRSLFHTHTHTHAHTHTHTHTHIVNCNIIYSAAS
jgi:hypothetical protein